MTKINLGAGTDIRDGYINHDIAKLPGIDVVHDLNSYPWPWEEGSVDEIVALDLLEHLDDFMSAMEEIHRVMTPGGRVIIKVPYWNSSFFHMDPTHKRGFHEVTFQFFDPAKKACEARPYYSRARFSIVREAFVLIPFAPYFKIPFVSRIVVQGKITKRIIGFLGNMFSNVILDLEVELTRLEPANAIEAK